MKKTMLTVLILMAGSQAFGAEKLNCLVSKFPAHSWFNFTDDKLITFKGEVDPGQLLIVDSRGRTEVKSEITKEQTKNREVFTVVEMLGLVMVVNNSTGMTAMAGQGVTLVDYKKGLAVTCGMPKQDQ